MTCRSVGRKCQSTGIIDTVKRQEGNNNIMIMDDEKTKNYFDQFTPEWPLRRYNAAIDIINKYATPGARLIDVGCGNGKVLQFIKDNTQLKNLTGMDVSSNYLTLAKDRLGCETILGSILDSELVASVESRFDFAIMGDMLHHLVGRTREESRCRAKQALVNAVQLLKKGGCLIIREPVFCSVVVINVIFYVKSFIARIASGRITLFVEWANIGMPVVSYFTDKQLDELLRDIGGAQCLHKKVEAVKSYGYLIRTKPTTVVLQKV